MGDAPPYRTWNDVATMVHAKPPFVIEEMIPAEGVVLIWGQSSVGKTPIMWHMARAIALGEDFCGYHTIKGNVLLVELDQPEIVTTERIKELPLLEGNPMLVVEHMNPLTHPLIDSDRERLEFLRDLVQPDVVFFDTLRKTHNLDDTQSETVQRVYRQFRVLFPKSALVFIHHERKRSVDDHRPPEESFSGNRAWINDAQIGFHTERVGPVLKMTCRKNQMGELDWSINFRLVDGVHLTANTEVDSILRRIIEEEGDPRKRAKMAAAELGVTERHARRRLRELEARLVE